MSFLSMCNTDTHTHICFTFYYIIGENVQYDRFWLVDVIEA